MNGTAVDSSLVNTSTTVNGTSTVKTATITTKNITTSAVKTTLGVKTGTATKSTGLLLINTATSNNNFGKQRNSTLKTSTAAAPSSVVIASTVTGLTTPSATASNTVGNFNFEADFAMFQGTPSPFEAFCATIANGFLKQLLEFEVQLRYFDGNMTAIAEDYTNLDDHCLLRAK